MAKTKPAEKMIEIAYRIFDRRGAEKVQKRKIVKESKVTATLLALEEAGHEIYGTRDADGQTEGA